MHRCMAVAHVAVAGDDGGGDSDACRGFIGPKAIWRMTPCGTLKLPAATLNPNVP